jgi:acyl carrier protein
MTQLEIELELIKCLQENIEECEDEIPELNESTGIFSGIAGFDSLRILEVLLSLEDVVGCELPYEKVFNQIPTGSESIRDFSLAVNKIVNYG